MSLVFIPLVSAFADAKCLSPFPLPHPYHWWRTGSPQAAGPSCGVQDANLEPHGWSCHHMGTLLQLCTCMPLVHLPLLASCVLLRWDPAVMGVHLNSQGHHCCLWAWLWPSLHCWTSLHLAIPVKHLHPISTSPLTGLHCHTRSHGETLQPQECIPMARVSSAAGVPAVDLAFPTGPGLTTWYVSAILPASTIGTYNWCVHNTGLGQRLLWSLATGPGGTTENPNSPHSHCGHSHSPHQKSCGCPCCGPQWPMPTRHHIILDTAPPKAPVLGSLHQ